MRLASDIVLQTSAEFSLHALLVFFPDFIAIINICHEVEIMKLGINHFSAGFCSFLYSNTLNLRSSQIFHPYKNLHCC